MLFVLGCCVIVQCEQLLPISLGFPGPTQLSHSPSGRLGNMGFRESFTSVRPVQLTRAPCSEGPHASKGPILGLTFFCHCFEILHNFWRRRPVFSFCTGSCKVSHGLVSRCLLFVVFCPFKFHISIEWIQSFCCCKPFINFLHSVQNMRGLFGKCTQGTHSSSYCRLQYGLACSGLNTFLIITTKGCYWHLVGSGQDATKHPTMHRTIS